MLRTMKMDDEMCAEKEQRSAEYFISVRSLEEGLSVRQLKRLTDREILDANDLSREIATRPGGQTLLTLASAGMNLRDHLKNPVEIEQAAHQPAPDAEGPTFRQE